MQNLIRFNVLTNETWGETIRHLKILDVQPHVLPNLKLNMFSCFIGMLFTLLLNLLQKLIGLGIYFFMPLDHFHHFFRVISLSHMNG
jgi:hypothetical protein